VHKELPPLMSQDTSPMSLLRQYLSAMMLIFAEPAADYDATAEIHCSST